MNTTPKTPHVHADIIKAWADGAMIQYRRSMAEVWTDLTTAAPIWHILFEYRIKPSNGFKHDECMDAFFKGAEIQYRKDETAEWMDTKDPNWHEVFEYRVKPTTCAQVYPASNLMPEELATLAYPNRQIKVPLLREVANAAIARAIDDGQVVRAGAPVSTPSGCWREDFGELSIVGPRLLVEQAIKQLRQFNSIAPNNADTSTFRWMGHTAREWQELCDIAEQSRDVKASDSNKFQDMYLRAERALVRAGFKDHGAEEWKPPVNDEATQLRAMGYVPDMIGNWHKSASDVVDASLDPDFLEVGEAENLRKIDELKDRLDVLPGRACSALCEYLGKSRDDVSFEVIQAIILLERNKP